MVIKFLYIIQLNLTTPATLGTEESGHCREATGVERFEQESMYGLSTQKSGCCREVAISGSLINKYSQLPLL